LGARVSAAPRTEIKRSGPAVYRRPAVPPRLPVSLVITQTAPNMTFPAPECVNYGGYGKFWYPMVAQK